MKDQLSRIETKLDTIVEDIHSIKLLDAVQNEQLSIHIKRTELLEKRIDSLPQKLLLYTSLMGAVFTALKTLSIL